MKHRGRIGGGDGDMKCIRVLNRVVEWRRDGIAIEPDQRHVEIAAEVMGLVDAKAVGTHGTKEHDEEGAKTSCRRRRRRCT